MSTDITTTDSAREALHVDPQEAYDREVEIAGLAAQLRSQRFHEQLANWPDRVVFERGARAGLTAYRECYELVRMIANTDPHDTAYDEYLVSLAEAALESAQ